MNQPKGQDDNKEKMSIRSEGLDSVSEQRRVPTNFNKIRKVSAVSVLILITFTKKTLNETRTYFIILRQILSFYDYDL